MGTCRGPGQRCRYVAAGDERDVRLELANDIRALPRAARHAGHVTSNHPRRAAPDLAGRHRAEGDAGALCQFIFDPAGLTDVAELDCFSAGRLCELSLVRCPLFRLPFGPGEQR